jgi:peptidoglycan/LPS O-acetylase OafA/YrhL
MKRNYAMDKVRILCAIIVASGHLFFIKGHFTSDVFMHRKFFEIFLLGPVAVAIFFGLSGMALARQTKSRVVGRKWLICRGIRLMPIYWIALVLPSIAFLLLKVEMNYSFASFVITFLGLNALNINIITPHQNGPLWSLSVEVFLSISVLFLSRISQKLHFIVVLSAVVTAITFNHQPILAAFPYFAIGFYLPRIDKLPSSFYKYICIPIILISVIFFPKILANLESYNLGYICEIVFVAIILLSCQSLSKSKPNIFSRISLRAYCLYAVHFPIIFVVDRAFFRDFQSISFLQVSASLILIIFVTEIAYRVIDLKAMKYSQSLWRAI